MSEWDDLFADPEPDPPVAVATAEKPPEYTITQTATESIAAISNGKPTSKHTFLYLDIETIPDYERLEQFDLPKCPPLASEAELLTAEEFCSQSLNEVKQFFDGHSAPESWLISVEQHEQSQKKPRVGLFEAIDKSRSAISAQRKLLSVTPEFCRIVAVGWAMGPQDVEARLIGAESEILFLDDFWKQVANVRTIVGYNLLHFDLPVILTRSALLGVTPSRRINLSPYRNTDVCDLMAARWPKGGQMKMKSAARALGIQVPAGDCDGGNVEMLYNSNPDRLKEYVASDVEVTRQLHQFWSGYFCD